MFTALASQLVHCYACCLSCGTVLLKPHDKHVKLLHFVQKEVGYHLTVALTIHSYVTIRSIFEEVRSNDATSPQPAPNCDFFWVHW